MPVRVRVCGCVRLCVCFRGCVHVCIWVCVRVCVCVRDCVRVRDCVHFGFRGCVRVSVRLDPFLHWLVSGLGYKGSRLITVRFLLFVCWSVCLHLGIYISVRLSICLTIRFSYSLPSVSVCLC